ncbi:MAG: hypothetical protein FJX47_15685, partial [Alphaproteobacteria bacterium]|nr:hypothetical protein [Alphaproteobacteria bacterium]
MRRVLALALVFFGFAAAAAAQDAVRLRGWTHPNYGRLVFDWPAPVGHEVRLDGERLILRFDRPMSADFARALANLGAYLKGARLSPDGREAVLELAQPVRPTSQVNGTAVVIDLHPDTARAATPAQPAPAGGRGGVMRAATRDAFDRLTVAWPEETEYQFSREGNRVTLAFAKPEAVNVAAVRDRPPPRVSAVAATRQNGRSLVAFDVPDGAQLRHYRDGANVVVDVVAPRPPPAPAPTPAPAPAAAQPEP